MKLILFSACLIVFFSCRAQQAKKTPVAALLDSNSYGKLYDTHADTLMFQAANGDRFYKPVERGTISQFMKLLDDDLLFLKQGAVLSYSFYDNTYDTLFQSDKINYFDNLIEEDSVIACFGNNALVVDAREKKAVFEVQGTFFSQNVYISKGKCYVLFGKSNNENELREYDLKTGQFRTIAQFETENVLLAHSLQNWSGMYVHGDLLFMQFFNEMIVFDLVGKKIIARTTLLKGDTVFLEETNAYIKFRQVPEGNIIKFKFKKGEFIKV